MGIAAYNRGSKRISEDLSAEDQQGLRALVEDLQAIQPNPKSRAPWGPTIISEGHGGWWIECATKRSGYWFKNLRDIFRSFRLRIACAEFLDNKLTIKAEPQ